MIILSLILFIFINAFRFSELKENTNVITLKDYFNYDDKIVIIFSIIWWFITYIVYLTF